MLNKDIVLNGRIGTGFISGDVMVIFSLEFGTDENIYEVAPFQTPFRNEFSRMHVDWGDGLSSTATWSLVHVLYLEYRISPPIT